jgi:hypothetical protein
LAVGSFLSKGVFGQDPSPALKIYRFLRIHYFRHFTAVFHLFLYLTLGGFFAFGHLNYRFFLPCCRRAVEANGHGACQLRSVEEVKNFSS